jgi:ribosomal protein S18 acetylase RimI-like enzyme
LTLEEYLPLYERVGASLRWDQRLRMPREGRRLGQWLLATALHQEWQRRPRRIWLHTDSWDHPAAVRVYERAGFEIYLSRDEPSGPL